MAYYVTIETDDKKRVLDISKLSKFKKTSVLLNGFSLSEIDSCTLSYDEEDFREELCRKGLIKASEIDNPISIVHRPKNEKELQKTIPDIAYKDAAWYFNMQNLYKCLINKCDDNEFLLKLMEYYHDSITSGSIMIALEEAIKSGNAKAVYDSLNAFFFSEILIKDTKTNKFKINYKNFRSLALFMYKNNISKKKLPLKQHKILEKRIEKPKSFIKTEIREIEPKERDKKALYL